MGTRFCSFYFGRAILALSLTSFANAESFKVDTSKSTVIWHGEKIVGSKHTGAIKIKSGSINIEKSKPTKGNFVIDMSTIKNSDVKDPKWKKKLENHLRSPDFFDIKKFKTAKYVIKSVKETGTGKYDLSGDLTIKGKTEPAKINTTATISKGLISAKGVLTFDRTKFDVKYGSGKFFENLGDKLISDMVTLDIQISASR